MHGIKIVSLIAFILAFSSIGYAANTYCISLTTGNICFNSTWTTGTKINWSDVLNPPSNFSGGTTIPVANVTNLSQSKQCSSTDKVKNVTINNSGLFVACDTDQTGGGGAALNITNPNLVVSTVDIINFTKNFTATNPSGSQALIDINKTNVQLRVSGTCTAGSSIRIIDENGGVTCENDDQGTGTVTQVNAGYGLNETSITTSGTLHVNRTLFDSLYFLKSLGIGSLGDNNITSLSWSKITSFPGVTGLAINTNYTFPGVTGLTLGTNYTFPGVTGLQINTNYTFPGVTNIPQANLSGLQIPSTNVTGGYTMPWSNVSGFPGVTGLTLGTNYTFPGVTGLTLGTNYTFPGVTGLAIGTNYTFSGITNLPQANLSGLTIPAANVSSGTFASGNWTFNANSNLSSPKANFTSLCLNGFGDCRTNWGTSGLTLGTNYTFPGVTGLAIGTNYTFNGITNLPQANLSGLQIPSTNVTGGYMMPWANVSGFPGISGIAQANLTGLQIPSTNVTGGYTMPWANVSGFPGVTGLTLGTNYTFPGVTGLTLGTNYTFPGVTGLQINTNYTFPGVTGLAINTNYTFPGVTGLTINTNYTFPGLTVPAANITAGTFATGNFSFQNNISTNYLNLNCTGTSCNISRTGTSQWIVWNTSGVYISGG